MLYKMFRRTTWNTQLQQAPPLQMMRIIIIHTPLIRCCLSDHFSPICFNELWVLDCLKHANWSNKIQKHLFKSISALKSALATNFTLAIWHFQVKLDIQQKNTVRNVTNNIGSHWLSLKRKLVYMHIYIIFTNIYILPLADIYIQSDFIAWESNIWLCI